MKTLFIFSSHHKHKQLFFKNISKYFIFLNKGKGKGKGKVLLGTGHEGPEGEQMHSSTLPSTTGLDGGGWSTPRLGHFTPGEKLGTHCILNKGLYQKFYLFYTSRNQNFTLEGFREYSDTFIRIPQII